MGRLSYICGSTGDTFDLDGEISYAGTALGLRGSRITYTLGYRSLLTMSNPARSVTIDVYFDSKDDADRLVSLVDADTLNKTPGTFIADGWEQKGYISSLEPLDITSNNAKITLECILLDGVWRRSRLVHMFPSSGDSQGSKTYTYEYPYRYASEYGVRSVTVDSLASVSFSMTIFGYAKNPIIRIGNNVYRFDVTISEGGYLLVDSRDCTAVLVGKQGERSNAYSKCERGTGEGCGTYAWERIPSGTSLVSWNDSFGFDLVLYEERSAPPFGDDA